MAHSPLNAQELIAALELEAHVEGGYFRRTFQSNQQVMTKADGSQRYLMTSIYYLLTEDSPVGHFHLNQSDIVHYYHLGDALQYSLISPDGTLQTVMMGNDIKAGQCLQLHVPGGVWKASQLMNGPTGFALISEAVSPGFDFADMEMGNRKKLTDQFAKHSPLIEKLSQG